MAELMPFGSAFSIGSAAVCFVFGDQIDQMGPRRATATAAALGVAGTVVTSAAVTLHSLPLLYASQAARWEFVFTRLAGGGRMPSSSSRRAGGQPVQTQTNALSRGVV
jgi:MFS family permease